MHDRAIEEHHNSDAMVKLGNLLVDGAEGIQTDAVRADELYENAIDQNESVRAMLALGVLLAKGAERVETNVVRAVDLCERATEKSQDRNAKFNRALVFSAGGDGVARHQGGLWSCMRTRSKSTIISERRSTSASCWRTARNE